MISAFRSFLILNRMLVGCYWPFYFHPYKDLFWFVALHDHCEHGLLSMLLVVRQAPIYVFFYKTNQIPWSTRTMFSVLLFTFQGIPYLVLSDVYLSVCPSVCSLSVYSPTTEITQLSITHRQKEQSIALWTHMELSLIWSAPNGHMTLK